MILHSAIEPTILAARESGSPVFLCTDRDRVSQNRQARITFAPKAGGSNVRILFSRVAGISDAYDRDGYAIVRQVLDAALLRELDRHIDWLIERHPELEPEGLGHHLVADDPFWVRFLSDPHLLDIAEIAGNGRNRSTYFLTTFDRHSWDGERRLLFENNLRLTEDNIADEYLVADEISNRNAVFHSDGLEQRNSVDFALIDKPPIVGSSFVTDNVLYRGSYVSETYLDARSPLRGGLSARQQLRLRLNWQQGGELYDGVFQRKRRLDFWSSISRLQYVYELGSASITAQYKFMTLRLIDRERDTRLKAELRSIPILRIDYQLLARTTLRAGFRGVGPLPYRLRDETSGRNSFEQRTAFATLTNFSGSFGYELITIAGISRNSRDFDTRFQDVRDFDAIGFFVRTLIGFSDFGRPI